MRQIRLFTLQDLHIDSLIALEESAKRHVDRVLRLKTGAKVTLFNGDGYDYRAEITELDRQQALVQIHSREMVSNECDIDITLYCALLKGEAMDRVVQKSVELGVKRLLPVYTKHSEVSLNAKRLNSKMAHWQGIIQASSQQCGRARIMQLDAPTAFAQAILNPHQCRWIFTPHKTQVRVDENHAKTKDIGLLIGPEGGFHASEVDAALINGWHIHTLGKRVLRADTAAISSILLAQFAFSQEFAHV